MKSVAVSVLLLHEGTLPLFDALAALGETGNACNTRPLPGTVATLLELKLCFQFRSSPCAPHGLPRGAGMHGVHPRSFTRISHMLS